MDEKYQALRSLSGAESTEEKMERILDCLVQMNEQYRYILCQLNGEQE